MQKVRILKLRWLLHMREGQQGCAGSSAGVGGGGDGGRLQLCRSMSVLSFRLLFDGVEAALFFHSSGSNRIFFPYHLLFSLLSDRYCSYVGFYERYGHPASPSKPCSLSTVMQIQF
jgi:hypothetical protein